jgi:hypothetical protein
MRMYGAVRLAVPVYSRPGAQALTSALGTLFAGPRVFT